MPEEQSGYVFLAVLMKEWNLTNKSAPSMVRKQPLTFNFTLAWRKSRSAWLLSKGTKRIRQAQPMPQASCHGKDEGHGSDGGASGNSHEGWAQGEVCPHGQLVLSSEPDP